jgi:hypothetical protein
LIENKKIEMKPQTAAAVGFLLEIISGRIESKKESLFFCLDFVGIKNKIEAAAKKIIRNKANLEEVILKRPIISFFDTIIITKKRKRGI